jgi:hypothetical protein
VLNGCPVVGELHRFPAGVDEKKSTGVRRSIDDERPEERAANTAFIGVQIGMRDGQLALLRLDGTPSRSSAIAFTGWEISSPPNTFASRSTTRSASWETSVVRQKLLEPRELAALGSQQLERFPTWSVIRQSPERVRGDTMRTVIVAISEERKANERTAIATKRALRLVLVAPLLIAAEAGILAEQYVSG